MRIHLVTTMLLALLVAGLEKESYAATNNDQYIEYKYELLQNGTIQLSVRNLTLQVVNGDLIREELNGHGEILVGFSINGGGTYTYIDDTACPCLTYLYVFEYFIEGPGWIINFDTLTPVSTIPALGQFKLIAASYDDEYEVLHDGYKIWLDNTNIRVDANADLTESVVFYLNGKRYADNTYPFALFGDVNGDYKKGRLRNGNYNLIAIAYPQKNGHGIPGDTAQVSFTVQITYEDRIMVYPNPVNENSILQVNGEPYASITITITDVLGNTPNKILYHGQLDSTGALTYSLIGLNKGVHILSVELNGRVIQSRLIGE